MSPARPPGAPPPWQFRGSPLALEWSVDGFHLRVVQPYRATKVYRCPGCDQEIWPGALHLVAWPEGTPEQRRHWHRPCFERHLAERRRAADRARRRRPRRD